jgi:anti-sigma factor RsiW
MNRTQPICQRYETQWTDYFDEALSYRERQDLESHLRACPNCRAQVQLLRDVDQRLRIECGLIQQAVQPSDEEQAAVQERVLAVLRQSAPKGTQERLWRVRWVLALLCGSNTATRIIEAAESHTEISVNPRSSEQKWLVFLRRLTYLTTEVCGCSAGELIWAVGK